MTQKFGYCFSLFVANKFRSSDNRIRSDRGIISIYGKNEIQIKRKDMKILYVCDDKHKHDNLLFISEMIFISVCIRIYHFQDLFNNVRLMVSVHLVSLSLT